MTIRILIVDDCAIVRTELHKALDLLETITVVGDAADGLEAIRLTEILKPDIVLMDLEMPGLDGFEATRQIKMMKLAQTVIILSVYSNPINQQKALEAGADAFIMKGTDLKSMFELFEKYSHP